MTKEEEIEKLEQDFLNYIKRYSERAEKINKEVVPNDMNKYAEMLKQIIIKYANDLKNVDVLVSMLNEQQKNNIINLSVSFFDIGVLIGIIIRDQKTFLPVVRKILSENEELQQKLKELLDRSKLDLPYIG